jgi:hypothetical protein
MFDFDQFLKSKHSSLTLIHESTIVYDLNLEQHDKNSLLRCIQWWKNWLSENNIRKIVIQEYLNLSTIALTYACLENKVVVYTCSKNTNAVKSLSQKVDAVLIGRGCQFLFDKDNKKYFMIDQMIQETTLLEYQESLIDLNSSFLVGQTSGSSTGTPKEVKHTARTFLAAAKCCTFFYYPGQRFSAYPNLNHIGMAANMVISPTLAGCTIYSISNMLELVMFCKRGIIDTIGLFTNQSNTLQQISTLLKDHGFDYLSIDFDGVEVLTGGSPLGPDLADWFFSNNGKRIRSMLGNNEVLMPLFVHDVYNQFDDFYKQNIGQPCPFVEYRIDEQNNLWVKTPSISEYVDTSADGFYNTTDLVVKENNEIHYKGRKRINDHFMTEVYNCILDVVWKEKINFNDYILHHNSETNKIVIMSHKLSVLDSFNKLANDVKKILLDFKCEPEFETLHNDGSNGIKYVLQDPNLVVLRNPKDY